MNKDYYKVLNVDKTASQEDIKKSYRKLAKTYHPDANPNQDAEAKMKEINLAYDVLSNPEKRRQYDQIQANPYAQQQYQTHSQGQSYSDPMQDIINEFLRQQQQRQYQNNGKVYRPNTDVLRRYIFWVFLLNLLFNFLIRLL